MRRSINLNPVVSLARALGLCIRGKAHFVGGEVGSVVRNGDDFVIFRHISVDPGGTPDKKPGAILKVRFLFARGSARVNMKLSLIPIPFIIGVPGFRSKRWMLGRETGEFQGVYEWDTEAAAEAYMTSFAIRLMKRRARPGTLSHEITAA